jgi:hypothetical protein
MLSYHIAAPKVIPTVMYTRPTSPKFLYRAGVPLRTVGNLECPFEHPHIPFSYFSAYPPPKLNDLGRTPLRPIASWFFPLQSPETYPVAPTNIILPPPSDFSVETHLVPIKEPSVEKAIDSLRLFATRHPADADLCGILIAALAQSSGQTFQTLEGVQASVDTLITAQSLDAASDSSMLTAEVTNKAGPAEAPTEVGSNTTVAAPEPTVPIQAGSSVGTTSAGSASPLGETDETKVNMTALHLQIGDTEDVRVDPLPLKESNQSKSENATVISNQRVSMSLRQSMKLSRGIDDSTDIQ